MKKIFMIILILLVIYTAFIFVFPKSADTIAIKTGTMSFNLKLRSLKRKLDGFHLNTNDISPMPNMAKKIYDARNIKIKN